MRILKLFCRLRYLIVTKCEVVSPPLEMEVKSEVKSEETGIVLKPKQENEIKSEVKSEVPGIFLKPKQEIVAKSAAQIVHEQRQKYVILFVIPNSMCYLILLVL